MTDSIAWLAEPQSIAWGGYSVVIAPDLESESLARRVAETAHRPASPRAIGELTLDGIALRHGELDKWSYVIKYGGWQGEFGTGSRPVDRGGLHVFHLEYEEENGKPVPPHFAYRHDENLMCAFNLHLDGSWGHGSPEGDPDVVTAVQERLSAAGLPDEDLDDSVVHRRCLKVLHRHFGLTLPRERILTETLPTLLLTRP